MAFYSPGLPYLLSANYPSTLHNSTDTNDAIKSITSKTGLPILSISDPYTYDEAIHRARQNLLNQKDQAIDISQTDTMSALLSETAAHKSRGPKDMTSKEYNVSRRKFEYPQKDDPRLAQAEKNLRVHSLEPHNPRFRVLRDWVECTNQTGPNKCTSSGLKGYFVEMEDGSLRRAFKLFKGMGRCGDGGGEGGDGNEENMQAEEDDG